MYSKRRYRNSNLYSMYSPYKMNHRPTYRQRKGQTLQRSISLHQGPSSSFTRDDLIKEGKRLVSEGIITYPLTFAKKNYTSISIKDFFSHPSSVPGQQYFYPSDLTAMVLQEERITPVEGYELEIALGVIEFNILEGQNANFSISLTSSHISDSPVTLISKTSAAHSMTQRNLSSSFAPISDTQVTLKTYTAPDSGSFNSNTVTKTVPESIQPVDSNSCGFYPMVKNNDNRTETYITYVGDIEETGITINICFLYYMLEN